MSVQCMRTPCLLVLTPRVLSWQVKAEQEAVLSCYLLQAVAADPDQRAPSVRVFPLSVKVLTASQEYFH